MLGGWEAGAKSWDGTSWKRQFASLIGCTPFETGISPWALAESTALFIDGHFHWTIHRNHKQGVEYTELETLVHHLIVACMTPVSPRFDAFWTSISV